MGQAAAAAAPRNCGVILQTASYLCSANCISDNNYKKKLLISRIFIAGKPLWNETFDLFLELKNMEWENVGRIS